MRFELLSMKNQSRWETIVEKSSYFSITRAVSFIIPDSNWMSGGIKPDRRIWNMESVGHIKLNIVCMVLFKLVFSFFLWTLLHHTDDVYSALPYSRVSNPVQSVNIPVQPRPPPLSPLLHHWSQSSDKASIFLLNGCQRTSIWYL